MVLLEKKMFIYILTGKPLESTRCVIGSYSSFSSFVFLVVNIIYLPTYHYFKKTWHLTYFKYIVSSIYLNQLITYPEFVLSNSQEKNIVNFWFSPKSIILFQSWNSITLLTLLIIRTRHLFIKIRFTIARVPEFLYDKE